MVEADSVDSLSLGALQLATVVSIPHDRALRAADILKHELSTGLSSSSGSYLAAQQSKRGGLFTNASPPFSAVLTYLATASASGSTASHASGHTSFSASSLTVEDCVFKAVDKWASRVSQVIDAVYSENNASVMSFSSSNSGEEVLRRQLPLVLSLARELEKEYWVNTLKSRSGVAISAQSSRIDDLEGDVLSRELSSVDHSRTARNPQTDRLLPLPPEGEAGDSRRPTDSAQRRADRRPFRAGPWTLGPLPLARQWTLCTPTQTTVSLESPAFCLP